MVVIIPNPNDQLTLVKLQEQLCKLYSPYADYLCKSFPLWIPLQNTSNISPNKLKEFSKTIKSVVIDSPDNTFTCSVHIQLENSNQTSDLKLLVSKNLKKISPQETTPMSLKTFRIGIIKENSTNTVSITDSVWVKL